ncbi:unnamed protein product [Closterium sp. NIES-64]|nr:unnamed protein product [Closterium sp. NIES-64]
MKPCARLSGLCGLAALVAGLVAISFLATHASAAGDPCTGGVCGVEASCTTLGPTEFLCNCNKEGFAFNEADKTCFPPLARTTVALKARGFGLTNAFFLSPLPAEQASASGTTVCGNLDVMLQGTTTITAVWNASNPASLSNDAPSNAMCKSLSFYAESFCKEKLGFTIARPAKKAMCENDCGTAQCVVKEGQPQCQCPEGLMFNAAKKLCLDPSLAPPRRRCLAVCCILANIEESASRVSVYGTLLCLCEYTNAPRGASSALAGSALAGSALAGSALAGSALAGSALAGSALAGSALAGSALAGSALAGSAVFPGGWWKGEEWAALVGQAGAKDVGSGGGEGGGAGGVGKGGWVGGIGGGRGGWGGGKGGWGWGLMEQRCNKLHAFARRLGI